VPDLPGLDVSEIDEAPGRASEIVVYAENFVENTLSLRDATVTHWIP
jgi:hypothetical protein